MTEPNQAIPIRVRPEEPGDHDRVRAIETAAFGQEAEARLVDRLRGRVSPEVSLVALTAEEAGDEIVGHIYFSPVRVGASRKLAMALGPVAVDPVCQKQSIGSELCRRGLEECRALGHPVVFVLGHPEYYPRFGFEPASAHGLYYKNEHFAPAFFVAVLEAGALAGYSGEVEYDPAFDET